MVQDMLSALPKEMQTDAAEVMQQVLAQGLPKSAIQLLGDEGETTAQRLTHIREQLQKQEQSAQTPIKIEYYHCDHLGTPMALTDQQGRIAWAAKLDPWGNLQEEYNPGGIEQPIRLPGQHHDRETGLYYNRHRYYDPAIGSYINQDPIGLMGGVHKYKYAASNPFRFLDPLGLDYGLGVDPAGAGGNGHTSLYFQSQNGQWYKYDQGASGATSSGGNYGFLSGQDATAAVEIKPIDYPPDGVKIYKSEKDNKIENCALMSQNSHNSGEKKYNLYSNNCTDAAVDVLSCAGIITPNPAFTVRPNSWFKLLP